MDLELGPDLIAFRNEVREFTRAHLPADIAARVLEHRRLDKDDFVRWQDVLARRGWLTGHWPQQFGGCGRPAPHGDKDRCGGAACAAFFGAGGSSQARNLAASATAV